MQLGTRYEYIANYLKIIISLMSKFKNSDLISSISKTIKNPTVGLPDEIFYFVSSITPLVCVDLLIKEEKGILLTWRQDEFYGPGWHLPGGVMRFKEKAHLRIIKTAKKELGVPVKIITKKPINIAEQINSKRDIRGHFIALLYRCDLSSELPLEKKFSIKKKDNGTWKWHKRFPKNMIKQHYIYKDFF